MHVSKIIITFVSIKQQIMRKLVSIYRTINEEARIFVTTKSFICEVKNIKTKEKTAYLCVSSEQSCEEKDLLPLDFINKCYKVPFENKNGKIVLYPVNKQKRIIWTNDDYEEWCEAMRGEITEEEITPEYYAYGRETDLDDERCNLNIEVDGHIVAFGNLGRWNGRFDGAKLVGTNVKDILYSDCDICTWYCDPYNVRLDESHHDGTNYILYRVAETKEKAKRIWEKIIRGDMDEEQFRRATKSLRPYVARIYGW